MKLMDKLIKAGGSCLKSSAETWEDDLVEFINVKNDLEVQNGVIFYKH